MKAFLRAYNIVIGVDFLDFIYIRNEESYYIYIIKIKGQRK